VWIGVSLAVGFPARLETIFQTLVAAVTLSMVFVIQRTQARHGLPGLLDRLIWTVEQYITAL
jgi:low affinity Fe/Cu permease